MTSGSLSTEEPPLRTWVILFFCGLTMSYGWVWRGSFGHEQGAMFAGALMGMAVCLASGRPDLYRRTAIAGLFGAIGWGWGGGLSNMEQTFYVRSDSFPDVAYAFACFFLFGMIWSGIGAACLSLALTLPRSQIRGFFVPLYANGFALVSIFVIFQLFPQIQSSVATFGVRHFHDSKFFSTSVILLVSSLVWLLRPTERPQSWLFIKGALAWWSGYLLLTKLGGLVLAPPHRSESWSGFVGVLVMLLQHLSSHRNRAGLILTIYGMVTGGLAFMFGLLIPHPMNVRWGIFKTYYTTTSWKWSEELIGLFMGMGIAAGVLRLVRGGLKSGDEDTDRLNSDSLAVLFLLIGLPWANQWKNSRSWSNRFELPPTNVINGLYAWQWMLLTGIAMTVMGLFVVWLYRNGRLRHLLPPTPFGKGAILFLLVLWTGQLGVAMLRLLDQRKSDEVLGEMSYWILATATTMSLLSLMTTAPIENVSPLETKNAEHSVWRIGPGVWVAFGSVPLLVLLFAWIATAVQDGPDGRSRWRFGQKAYWRNPATRSEVSLESTKQKRTAPDK